MQCQGLQKLKVWTYNKLQEALQENKWFLSELEHHDVGLSAAESDFLDNHCAECGAKWRVKYCRDICEFSDDCELGKAFIKRDGNEEY